MLIHTLSPALAIALLGGLPAQAATAPFSITIAAPEASVKAGAEVRLDIVLTNTSGREITIAQANGRAQAEFNYALSVGDARGQPAAETDYGRALHGEGDRVLVTSDRTVTLAPGATLHDQAVLSHVFDLSHPGRYAVQVLRYVPEGIGSGLVKSNVATVSVSP